MPGNWGFPLKGNFIGLFSMGYCIYADTRIKTERIRMMRGKRRRIPPTLFIVFHGTLFQAETVSRGTITFVEYGQKVSSKKRRYHSLPFKIQGKGNGKSIYAGT